MSVCFQTAQQVHSAFIEGREAFHNTFVKYRYRGSNAWQGRLPEKEFPLGHGTTVRGHKLGRMAPPKETRWRKLVDDQCNSNICSYDPQSISFAGSYDYTYGINKTEMFTDWMCIESFLYKHNIKEEIQHIENQLVRINRFVEEQFSRVRYIDFAENKWVGLLPPNKEREYCASGCFSLVKGCQSMMENQSWMFESYPDLNNPQPNENIVRVNMPWTWLYRISPLSIDQLRHVLQDLHSNTDDLGLYGQYEEKGSLEDSMSPINLGGDIELLLSDTRTRSRLQEEVSFQSQVAGSIFNTEKIDRRLGIEAKIENFLIRYDKDLMRYAPLPVEQQPVPEDYDCDDPTTWAILCRVDRFEQKVVTRKPLDGCGPDHQNVINVPSKHWENAPFHIAIPFIRGAGCLEKHMDAKGEGTAKAGDWAPRTGEVEWMNPPWPCNINGNWGFWRFQHRLAYHPRHPELGHAILYRADHSMRLSSIMCDMRGWTPTARYATQCAPATTTTELPVRVATPIC